MGKFSSLLFGAGAGAALMYFMDKDQGLRRRAMVRDRVMHARYQVDDAIETSVQDLRNRVKGILAEGMATVSNEPANDQIMAERIRARLGIMARHPRAMDVTVQDGVATLQGDVLEGELAGLLRGVGKMRGVRRVENRLRTHQDAGNITQLQGEGELPGDGHARQWSPASRLLAGSGAMYLFLYGRVRGGIIGTLSQISGMVLGARAIGNLPLQRMTGSADQNDAIRVRKSINIQAPVDEVYGLWSNFENFPRFMSNIEQIKDLGEGRSHWVVKGPAGSKVEFDAMMTENRPNEMIAWETIADSQVKHHGQVRFKVGASEDTQVNVNMAYTPPAGVVGHAVASLFGVDPKQSMDQDLQRLKSLLEEGKSSAGKQKETRPQVPVTGKRKQDKGEQHDGLNAVAFGEGEADQANLDDQMGDLGTLTDMDDLNPDQPIRNSE